MVALAQATTHELASVAPKGPLPVAVPFLHGLRPYSLLLHLGVPCINPQSVVQAVYEAYVFPPSRSPPLCLPRFRSTSWSRSGHSSLPWSERVFLTYLATCTGAGCHVSGIRLPP